MRVGGSSSRPKVYASALKIGNSEAKFKPPIFLGDKLILSDPTGKTDISELSEICQ